MRTRLRARCARRAASDARAAVDAPAGVPTWEGAAGGPPAASSAWDELAETAAALSKQRPAAEERKAAARESRAAAAKTRSRPRHRRATTQARDRRPLQTVAEATGTPVLRAGRGGEKGRAGHSSGEEAAANQPRQLGSRHCGRRSGSGGQPTPPTRQHSLTGSHESRGERRTAQFLQERADETKHKDFGCERHKIFRKLCC